MVFKWHTHTHSNPFVQQQQHYLHHFHLVSCYFLYWAWQLWSMCSHFWLLNYGFMWYHFWFVTNFKKLNSADDFLILVSNSIELNVTLLYDNKRRQSCKLPLFQSMAMMKNAHNLVQLWETMNPWSTNRWSAMLWTYGKRGVVHDDDLDTTHFQMPSLNKKQKQCIFFYRLIEFLTAQHVNTFCHFTNSARINSVYLTTKKER